jgi:hypothetical protein
MYRAELVGGPKDGEIYTLAEDQMTVRFATADTSGMFTTGNTTDRPTSIDIKYIEYLRTKRYTAGGNRIYLYVLPPKQVP